jgi:BirA family biotin operon repressor/biotin-[acetyl-CoA-carboxylase] ligase
MIPTVDERALITGRDAPPDMDPAAIARLAGLPAGDVEVVDEIDSTNAELMRRPFPAVPSRPRVLVALRQHAGRGRRGRTWLSDPDHSLTMSVVLHRRRGPASPPLTGMSLALAVSLAEELSGAVPGIGLKWPNDLLRDGRKIAGMLIETRQSADLERVVIGLGLNLIVPEGISRSVQQPVAGLFDGLAPVPGRARLAATLAATLIASGERFFEAGFADTALRWQRFDVLAGRELTILEKDIPVLQGRGDGVERDGALRVRTPAGVVPVSVGDVSARLAPAPPDRSGRA